MAEKRKLRHFNSILSHSEDNIDKALFVKCKIRKRVWTEYGHAEFTHITVDTDAHYKCGQTGMLGVEQLINYKRLIRAICRTSGHSSRNMHTFGHYYGYSSGVTEQFFGTFQIENIE